MSGTLWLYCANLHHGGIVVSAASFLDEVQQMQDEGWFSIYSGIRVTASQSVVQNMSSYPWNDNAFIRFELRDDRPLNSPLKLRSASAVRLIFSGPEYLPRASALEVCGFHDANILGPMAETVQNSGLRTGLKRRIQRCITRRYDAFFTETASMARVLDTFQPEKRVLVVPNAPSAVFADPSQWIPSRLRSSDSGTVRLFYPGRGYAHKNHAILPEVIDLFERDCGVKLEVVTTLRSSELTALGLDSTKGIINVGEVAVQQLPPLYASTDGVLFPSLRELASVTPLEAMLMRKPVFAGNRDFILETCGSHVNYVDPTSPSDIARVLKQYFLFGHGVDIEGAYSFAQQLPTPRDRAHMLVEFVNELWDSQEKSASTTLSAG